MENENKNYSDDLKIIWPTEKELKDLKEQQNEMTARIIEANSLLPGRPSLKEAKNEAVGKEDYELAAKIRDRMREKKAD